MIRYVAVMIALALLALALVAGAAALYAVGEIRRETPWKVGAFLTGVGAGYVLSKIRTYAEQH
jgi:hypothetical protein